MSTHFNKNTCEHRSVSLGVNCGRRAGTATRCSVNNVDGSLGKGLGDGLCVSGCPDFGLGKRVSAVHHVADGSGCLSGKHVPDENHGPATRACRSTDGAGSIEMRCGAGAGVGTSSLLPRGLPTDSDTRFALFQGPSHKHCIIPCL